MSPEQRSTLIILYAFAGGVCFSFMTAALFASEIGWGSVFVVATTALLTLSARQAARLWLEAEMSDPATLSKRLEANDE